MRRGELIINCSVVLGPLVIGFGSVFSAGLVHSMPRTSFWAMVVLFVAGFSMFAKAKWSVIKQGKLLTFGPAQMSKQDCIFHFLGYFSIGLGFLMLLGFVLTRI
jgi:hypothetical protein